MESAKNSIFMRAPGFLELSQQYLFGKRIHMVPITEPGKGMPGIMGGMAVDSNGGQCVCIKCAEGAGAFLEQPHVWKHHFFNEGAEWDDSVGDYFVKKGDFALEIGCFENRKDTTPILCEDRGS